jgi:hypothetical protein
LITLAFAGCKTTIHKDAVSVQNEEPVTDSLFPLQHYFQEKTDELERVGYFKIDDEMLQIDDFLKTEDDMRRYADFIIKTKYPKAEIGEIKISEDRTKELWFVVVTQKDAYLDGGIRIIVSKKNCKIIYLGR